MKHFTQAQVWASTPKRRQKTSGHGRFPPVLGDLKKEDIQDMHPSALCRSIVAASGAEWTARDPKRSSLPIDKRGNTKRLEMLIS
jgi:hypothetical protein